jgi:predicted permease
MPTDSILHVLTVLTPTFFVLALGYAAGRYHYFNGEKSKGLTELVLDFALPSALFIGIVTSPVWKAVVNFLNPQVLIFIHIFSSIEKYIGFASYVQYPNF